jgi:cell division protein FtsL
MPSPRDGFYTIGKAIDNSNVVRERDPRTGRDIGWILLLAALVTAGVAFYAWPHLKARQTAIATEQASRERERLLEENRKLRLEKAALENLRRVETIATRQLGLQTPDPSRTVVVEVPPPDAPGTAVADAPRPADRAAN